MPKRGAYAHMVQTCHTSNFKPALSTAGNKLRCKYPQISHSLARPLVCSHHPVRLRSDWEGGGSGFLDSGDTHGHHGEGSQGRVRDVWALCPQKCSRRRSAAWRSPSSPSYGTCSGSLPTSSGGTKQLKGRDVVVGGGGGLMVARRNVESMQSCRPPRSGPGRLERLHQPGTD